ncbi:hypothetical protein BCR43DRAFT_497622 [Syncephalastrum racemosum]|uniref:Uncharacterized protein n=1 Tax=Syncephalastrum racemosum TaxID=13706 RepID=A0A1X2H2M7_SYNRA|nr:hypothetical protein BCR43DRAFT_497622 [Syncephalastrum racemosum]
MLSPCVVVADEVIEACSSLIHRKPAVADDIVLVLGAFDVGNVAVPAAGAVVFTFSASFLFAWCSALYTYRKKKRGTQQFNDLYHPHDLSYFFSLTIFKYVELARRPGASFSMRRLADSLSI